MNAPSFSLQHSTAQHDTAQHTLIAAIPAWGVHGCRGPVMPAVIKAYNILPVALPQHSMAQHGMHTMHAWVAASRRLWLHRGGASSKSIRDIASSDAQHMLLPLMLAALPHECR
jgi:hypothetical protein